MWNLFKTMRQKREQKRLLAERKVVALKEELKLIREKAHKLEHNDFLARNKEEQERNSTCPKCQSKNVSDRITRLQGSLKGELVGSSWNALTFGESSMHGKMKGEMDTNEVNKCSDCQHEWKKHIAFRSYSNILNDQIHFVRELLQKFYYAEKCTFDAKDLEEKFYSLQEKKTALLKEANEDWRIGSVKRFWDGASLDALKYLTDKDFGEYASSDYRTCYNETLLLSWGFKKITY